MRTTCPNCGREADRGKRFCDDCGAFLGWGAGESAESQLLPRQTPQRDDQRAGVQLQIKSDSINVAPGNAESTTFTVKNIGTQVEEFRFFLTGPAWIVVEPAAMSVYPGQESTGAVQAAPPRAPSSLAGVTPFRLTVTSALHANVSSSAAGRVDVAPYAELAAELAPASSRGRGLTRHHVRLDNHGNVPLRVALNATDVAEGLRLEVPPFADVSPGMVAEVPVAVHGPWRWFGRPMPKSFSIIAQAPKPLAATRLSGTRTVNPMFPGWVPVAAAGLVAAAVVGAAVIPKLTAHKLAAQQTPGSSAQANLANTARQTTPAANNAGQPSPATNNARQTTPAANNAGQSPPASNAQQTTPAGNNPPTTPGGNKPPPTTPPPPAGAEVTSLTPLNGWTGGPYSTAQPSATLANGVVHLQGAIASGASAGVFTLPPALRPAASVYVPVDLCNAANGRLLIQPDGTVQVQAQNNFSDAQCFTSLDGASYVLAPGTPVTPLNGWTGGPYSTAQPSATLVNGVVHLQGSIASGASAGVFTLPPALRPAASVYVPVDLCNAANGRLLIQPDGTVQVQAQNNFSDAQCFTSLDGASYVR